MDSDFAHLWRLWRVPPRVGENHIEAVIDLRQLVGRSLLFAMLNRYPNTAVSERWRDSRKRQAPRAANFSNSRALAVEFYLKDADGGLLIHSGNESNSYREHVNARAATT